MFFAVLTTFFFASSVLLAKRASDILGPMRAFVFRSLFALFFLALYVLARGTFHPSNAGLPWFFVSGIIGFGIGDLALFRALAPLGARLSLLVIQCLAVPFAGFMEWGWMGVTPTLTETFLISLILGGVALALVPREGIPHDPAAWRVGIAWGVVAALGQAGGAVLSRRAFAALAEAGQTTDGLTSTFERMLGGVIVALLVAFLIQRGHHDGRMPMIKVTGWSALNALAGPVLGVGCYQAALQTTPSALVLPVVAASPMVAMFLAWKIEGDRPPARSIVGAMLAVASVAALAWMRNS